MVRKGISGMRVLEARTQASAAEVHEAICGLALADALQTIGRLATEKGKAIRRQHGLEVADGVPA